MLTKTSAKDSYSVQISDFTKPGLCRYALIAVTFLFLLMSLSSCGAVTDAQALINNRSLYREPPEIVGARGPKSPAQSQEIIDHIDANQKVPSQILDRDLAFEQAISDVPLVAGNKVTLLENGAQTYAAMLAAIRGAKNNINMEMFIFSDGPIGTMFADALIERQLHGVQVNLSYDSLGSFSTSSAFFNQLRSYGILVMQYRPINPFESRLPWSFSHRDHRKMLLVDGRIAFTGGINVSEVYGSMPSSVSESRASAPKESEAPLQYWRDTDVEIEGPVVAEFQKVFITQWNYQKGPPLKPCNYFPPLQPQGHAFVRVIASVPERFSVIYVALISAIVNSETNVYITDAYFAPDSQMQRALKSAAKRGVDVRLLVPSQTDEPMIVSAARSHYAELLKAGVKIYEWQGEMLHAKTITVDGVWSTVGTSNLDWWSIARDNEINAIILSHSFGDDMHRMFFDDLKHAKQVTIEQWTDRGFGERIEEFAAGLVEEAL